MQRGAIFAVVLFCVVVWSVSTAPTPSKRASSLSGITSLLSVLGPSFQCTACKLILALFRPQAKDPAKFQGLLSTLSSLCKQVAHYSLETCQGGIKLYEPMLLDILNDDAVTPAEICGMMLFKQCASQDDPFPKWDVALPNTPKPKVLTHKVPAPGAKKLRVLHLTDIHIDPLYEAGSNIDCGQPLCCRQGNGLPATGHPGAGKWGHPGDCDLPPATLDNMFQHLASIQDQFDFIIWTGDIPPHNTWNLTKEEPLEALAALTKQLIKYFPNKPIFPALGNHESYPVNSFPPPYVTGANSISWLYDAVATAWSPWLANDTMANIKLGAYYTVSPFPGFRIISVNSNYCNNFNLWMLRNMTDPTGELAWLVSVLDQAERNKEKVHIIGHIPPGYHSCMKHWSWNYYKIINRYESTIMGQFFGHTHHDHFEMFYDETDLLRPVGVGFIGGSVTPQGGVNPNYRIYDVDGNYPGSSWAVLDHHTYIMDLAEANVNDKPEWTLEYSAKAAYNMTGFTAHDWDDVLERMKTDDNLFQLYIKYFTKSFPDSPCTGACKTKRMCRARSGRTGDPELCKNINIPKNPTIIG